MSVRQVTKLLQTNKNVILRRCLTGKTTPQTHPLAAKYKHYQLEDGIPVYLKGGFGDRILFQITLLLCAIGLADGLSTLYSMAFRKKK